MRFKIRCTINADKGSTIRKVCDTDSPEIGDYSYKHTVENVGKTIVVMYIIDGELSKVEMGKYGA